MSANTSDMNGVPLSVIMVVGRYPCRVNMSTSNRGMVRASIFVPH